MSDHIEKWNDLSPEEEGDEKCVILIAVGDIMLGRRVGERLKSEAPGFSFVQCQHILSSGHVLFGNLETVFSSRGSSLLKQGPNLRSDPSRMLDLKEAGFSLLNLVNNHCMDYGEEALFDTLELLEKNGLHYVGAGKTIEEVEQPQILERNGMKMAFVGFADREESFASRVKPGAAEIKVGRIEKIIRNIKSEVDIIVISLHTGVEFSPFPSPENVKTARTLIDCGAHLILGHHPHVYQGIEVYKHGLISYSLGNFIFDYDTQIRTGGTNKGFILKIRINRDRVRAFKIIPFGLTEHYQVKILDNAERDKFLRTLNQLSLTLKKDKFLRNYWYFLCKYLIAEKIEWMKHRFTRSHRASSSSTNEQSGRKITPTVLRMKLATQFQPLNRKLFTGFVIGTFRKIFGRENEFYEDSFEGSYEERLSNIFMKQDTGSRA